MSSIAQPAAGFPAALQAVFRDILGDEQGGNDQERVALRYLRDDDRIAEATEVSRLVEAFIESEVDFSTSAHRPIGRFSPVSLTKPVGQRLAKALARADDQTRLGLKDTLVKVMAIGYSAMIDAEASSTVRVDPGRDPRAIWNFWVVRIAGGDVDQIMDPTVLRNIRDLGRGELLSSLKALGLAPRIGKTKLALSGMFYAQAGLLLRVLQTDAIARDQLEGPDLLGLTNQWPYEAYVR